MDQSPKSSVFSGLPQDLPGAVKLTPAQAQELQSFAAQIQDLQTQRTRFVLYCLREHDSVEEGPFELVGDILVPVKSLPPPVSLD